jgi:hypothetical protein
VSGERTPDPRSGLDAEGRFVPVFEGQREPFAPGHELSVKHGAYADVKLTPRTDELADQIRDGVPGRRPVDDIAIRLLALCLARVEAAAAVLGDEVASDARARLEQDMRRWTAEAGRWSDRLGLSPAARARLGVDVAIATRALTLTAMAEDAEHERHEARKDGGS